MPITVLTYTPPTPGTIAHPRRHGTDTRERGVTLYIGVLYSVHLSALRSVIPLGAAPVAIQQYEHLTSTP